MMSYKCVFFKNVTGERDANEAVGNNSNNKNWKSVNTDPAVKSFPRGR